MEKVDITIIGAGVVGLAIAYELSNKYSVIVLEKNSSFGQETSSRNSEVIHAGLYYPKDSLKAKHCVPGNRMLYEYCSDYNIKHNKCGKIVVAVNNKETEELENLFENAKNNGVENIELISKEKIKSLEPNIKASAGLLSLSTGILDTHSLMESFALKAKANGAMTAYNSKVTGIEKTKNGYLPKVDGQESEFESTVIINSAGLYSGEVSDLFGINNYKIHYCKGDYFRIQGPPPVKMLVYPVPSKDATNLGVHLTPDLQGSIRLGPNAYYVDKLEYNVNEKSKHSFYESVKTFLPSLKENTLVPDTSGIRSKLQGPGEGFRDFVIKDEKDNNLPGFINLIGIESPGLTSCLSIADYIAESLKL